MSIRVIIEPDVFKEKTVVYVVGGTVCDHWHVRRIELRGFLRERFPHAAIVEYRNCENRAFYQSYGWASWDEELQDWVVQDSDLWKTGFIK
jgi:hypothetical protein